IPAAVGQRGRELSRKALSVERTEQVEETGIDHRPERSGKLGGMERVPDTELRQPANIRRSRRLGTGLVDRGLGQIDTQNGEAARPAAEVEHGAGGWILVEQRDQVRLRLADVPRRRLPVGRIEEVA